MSIHEALDIICEEEEKIEYLAKTIKNPALKGLLLRSQEKIKEMQNYLVDAINEGMRKEAA